MPHPKKHLPGKSIFIFLILLLAWSILHEFIHGAAIVLSGHGVEFGFHVLYATATCIDCTNVSGEMLLFFAVLPYVVDLIVLAGYLAYVKAKPQHSSLNNRRNPPFMTTRKLFFFISTIAFIDVIVNYFAMIAYLFDKNAAIDFIIMGAAGYTWLPSVIAIIAAGLWIYGNKEMVSSRMKGKKR